MFLVLHKYAYYVSPSSLSRPCTQLHPHTWTHFAWEGRQHRCACRGDGVEVHIGVGEHVMLRQGLLCKQGAFLPAQRQVHVGGVAVAFPRLRVDVVLDGARELA